MSQGERASRLRNSRGRDYWSKVDKVFGPGQCRMWSVGNKSGINKITKRLTHKSIRQKVRAWINQL